MFDHEIIKCEAQIYDEIMRAYKQENKLFPFYEIIKLIRLRDSPNLNMTKETMNHILTNSLILINTLFLQNDRPQAAPEIFV